ncbi:serine/threonine kinase [Fusarium proliferatum]|nr:serine/threonine kinase [Fusarium proliferatum]
MRHKQEPNNAAKLIRDGTTGFQARPSVPFTDSYEMTGRIYPGTHEISEQSKTTHGIPLPSPPVSDGCAPAGSQEFKAKSQIVAHSEAFSEKDDDWLFDHTKIILRIGNDYFAASSQQRESRLKNLDHSSLDLTLIPRHHYCPKLEKGISKAPETLSLDDVYLKQPSLISWDAKDPNPTSIADLVLQEAEICETLKNHPHPNIVRYFGCLGDDDKIVGLVLGKYTSKLSDKVADSTPDQRVKLYEGAERGVRHLH